MILKRQRLPLALTLSTISLLSLVLLGSLKSPQTTAPRSTTGANSESPHCRPILSSFTTLPDEGFIYTSSAWFLPSIGAMCFYSPRTISTALLVGLLKRRPQCLMYSKPVQATLTRERWTKSTITCLRWEVEGQ